MGHVASFTYAKINAFDYNNLSLRSQFANWLRNPHPLCTAQKRTSAAKRTDSHVASLLGMTEVVFILPFLLPNGTLSTPETPQALTYRHEQSAKKVRTKPTPRTNYFVTLM